MFSICMRGSRAVLSLFLRGFTVACLLALAGCATPYVDNALKEVSASEIPKPVEPRPVQLIFEFQTQGKLNTRATDFLKAQVAENLRSSGLFAAIDDKPVAGGALLSVMLNNLVEMDDAAKKGFIAGMTFGLEGSYVTDGYVCTVSYLAPGGTAPILKTVRHAIHTAVGNAGTVPNATKAASLEDAVRTMTRQALSAAMNDLARDPAFGK